MKKHQSIRNAFQAEHARKCSCKAYVEIFNKGRWIARGFFPIPTVKPTVVRCVRTTKKYHSSGTRPAPDRMIVHAKLYCRCEVLPGRPAEAMKIAA